MQSSYLATVSALLLALVINLSVSQARASEWVWAENLAPGTTLPEFQLTDLDNNPMASASLYRDTEVLLFFNRSTEW